MAVDIVVPTLGESVTEATVAQWLKQVGDPVAMDEPLVELETDKVTLEVNATEAGTLSEILAEAGANVEVGALLGRLGAGGAAAAAAPAQAKAPAPPAAEPTEAKPAPAAPAAPAPAEPAPVSGGAPVEILVPQLGESVTEATVAQWLKQPGEAVKTDDPLVELETDKVTLEVNATADGVLGEVIAEAGATVEVGAILGTLLAGASGGSAPAPAPEEAAKPAAPPPAAAGPAEAPAPSGVQTALDPSAAPRSGPNGTITAADLRAFAGSATSSSAMTLSPAVARLVSEHGLDPNRIDGTGPQGRIIKDDVIAIVEGRAEMKAKPSVSAPQAPAGAPTPSAATPAQTAPREERVRMTKLRQTIARRLKEAQNTAAMLTTFNEVDMGAVMALRSRVKESFEKRHGVKLGFTSFFAKAVVQALKDIPAINARIDGDEIVYNKFFDIGMAVSTPNGLMVPVIRDCDSKSFAEIEQSLGDLAARARDGKLSLEEMQGGSFTITNGGVFGSLLSTPILNAPQSGILGLHKIQDRPMAVDGKVEVRPMMYLALSYDHRIVDGREAVTFLVRVKDVLEDPERLMLDL